MLEDLEVGTAKWLCYTIIDFLFLVNDGIHFHIDLLRLRRFRKSLILIKQP